MPYKWVIAFAVSCFTVFAGAEQLSEEAIETAHYAAERYHTAQIETLAELVAFQTYAKAGLALTDNPEFTGFRKHLIKLAESFGLRAVDHGSLVIISLGDQEKRVGILTHGDVQPADPSQWQSDPFRLDKTSEPGRLLGRGTEDDKGPIATAVYAMKAIKERDIPLRRGIDLFVYLGEESDWQPLIDFIAKHPVPDLNVTIDASYPVVTAEKGFSSIAVTIPQQQTATSDAPALTAFSGGAFASQIPGLAHARIENASPALMATLQQRARAHGDMNYGFTWREQALLISAKGTSAHSSTPERGINAVAHLADLLGQQQWPPTTAAHVVAYLNELVGIGYLGEQFGEMAYRHEFMGPMTLAPTLVKEDSAGIRVTINIRRPFGKSAQQLTEEAKAALSTWQTKHRLELHAVEMSFGEPLYVKDAPHVDKLLAVFAHFTDIKDPQPIAIGGSTNAKLLPNAVSFGPAMPGVAYTGHSEHEFITAEQLKLNLKMYTAMMIEMGQL